MKSGLRSIGVVIALGLALSGCKDDSQLNGYYYSKLKTAQGERYGTSLLLYIKDGKAITGRTLRYPLNFAPEELIRMGENADADGKFEIDGEVLTVNEAFSDRKVDWIFKRIGGGKDLICTNCDDHTRYEDLTYLGDKLDLSKTVFRTFALNQENPQAFDAEMTKK